MGESVQIFVVVVTVVVQGFSTLIRLSVVIYQEGWLGLLVPGRGSAKRKRQQQNQTLHECTKTYDKDICLVGWEPA
jgi:hypothetical protein